MLGDIGFFSVKSARKNLYLQRVKLENSFQNLLFTMRDLPYIVFGMVQYYGVHNSGEFDNKPLK